MDKYILTGLFTLVPEEFCTPDTAREALAGQFSIDWDFELSYFPLEKSKAVVVYPSLAVDGSSAVLPFVVRLIKEASTLQEHNKVVFHYSPEKGLSHTIIYMGEELKLANSFKADSFESALYFLFLSIKGLQMNPRQCTVRVCNCITEMQEKIFAKFFKGFDVNNLDILLQ